MKKVTVKELLITNIDEILLEIERNIKINPNVQFLISYELIKRLINENKDCVIWKEDVIESINYCDNVEKAFLLNLLSNDTRIFQLHYVRLSIEYILVTFFACKGTIFRNYNRKVEDIFIIKADQL